MNFQRSKSDENFKSEKMGEIILATRAGRLAAKLLDFFFFLLVIFLGLIIASLFGEMSFRDLYVWVLELQVNEIKSVPNTTVYSPNSFQVLVIGLSFIAVLLIQSRLLIRDGQTIGKKILGIRILNAFHLGKVKWKNIIFLRWILFEILSILPYGIVIILVDIIFIIRKDRRCLHDLLSGTIVAQKTS